MGKKGGKQEGGTERKLSAAAKLCCRTLENMIPHFILNNNIQIKTHSIKKCILKYQCIKKYGKN